MSIMTDQAVKELQEKVAWLEKTLGELTPLLAKQGVIIESMGLQLEQITKAHTGPAKPLGLPHGKGKPS